LDLEAVEKIREKKLSMDACFDACFKKAYLMETGQ
jgi:hypothetical protein